MKYRRIKFFKFANQSPEHQRIPPAAFIETANLNILCSQFRGEFSARIKRNDRDIKPIFTQTRNHGCYLPFSAAPIERANEEDNLDHKRGGSIGPEIWMRPAFAPRKSHMVK